jgi:hypothetical protein
MGILALQALAHQRWCRRSKKTKWQWNKAWYAPFDKIDKAALGLWFTLRLPVTAMIPLGHWGLVKMAFDLTQAGAMLSLSDKAQKIIRQIARRSDPLFSLHE